MTAPNQTYEQGGSFVSGGTFSFRQCWLVEEARELNDLTVTHQPLAVYLSKERAERRAALEREANAHREGMDFVVSQLWLEESAEFNDRR